MRYVYHAFIAVFICFASIASVSEKVFRDRSFQNGFRLSAVDSSMKPVEVATILAVDADEPAAWRLAQWGTRFSLESAVTKNAADGMRTIANDGKTVVIHPGGLAGEGITLTVNGGAEYGSRLRQQGEFWPHLLIEQSMPADFRPGRLDRLAFNLDFRVDYCRSAVAEPLDPGLHTAHITAFWTLHNRNPESSDFKDMIWFGLPLFDARHPIPRGHQAVDRGKDDATGKFICTLEGSRFYTTPTGDGQWHTLDADLVPLIKEALAASQAKGFLVDTDVEDLQMTSFNLGWEVPGPYDCAITLRELRLDGTAP